MLQLRLIRFDLNLQFRILLGEDCVSALLFKVLNFLVTATLTAKVYQFNLPVGSLTYYVWNNRMQNNGISSGIVILFHKYFALKLKEI